MEQNRETLEGTRADFSVQLMLEARAKAKEAVHRIAAKVHPGMAEEYANTVVAETLQEMGSSKNFHKAYIRFGTNTTKTFGAESDPGVVLGEDDIFFIDVGPVFGEYEGDAGDTFVTGNNRDFRRAAEDARNVFNAVLEKWKTEKATGAELYNFAEQKAKELGWTLNLDLGGHRLGDFPSGQHYEGPLSEITFTPAPNLWMVEIHLLHPEQQFGSFYEDLLM
ncbi:aminopeptidase P family protein [Geomonas sp. RF6]|uniref:M24 family metallopeptidase n=1 Tax=Geomonas sp. RF6 TaxID=2897342 RepID=UPI001E4712E0|nr:M24 family metallopeptidase [Geomonas sp. RF6]UFS71910.1 aminopeptidase P family protein [Geomonas sp. RF6]